MLAMPGPLAGVRVVDCTTVVLGPWAAQQLGDLGADVIKVEPPEGDTTRQLGPMRNPHMGAFYLAVNRNKRSIVLNLKQESARRVLLRLAERADVLLHNYRPQAARRLGLSYQMFRAVNPGFIYVATYAATRTNAEWLAELDRHNIPAMIVNSLETLLRDPQLEATGFWQLVEHPSEGTVRLPGIPATYSKTPGNIRRLPPRLGEHSLEVLREAGLGEAEIDALLASGAARTERSR